MTYALPRGFRAAGVHCGIKQDPQKEDLALVVSDRDMTAAGVYTKNRVCAAPVQLDRQRTPLATSRAVVINSGNANACTGERGMQDAVQMTEWTAGRCEIDPGQVLVLSTGVIGAHLPMEAIRGGIEAAGDALGDSSDHVTAAARGMLTTDSHPKFTGRALDDITPGARLLGLAKGAAMIGPNMATMLGVIATDLALAPDVAQEMLSSAVNRTFNCISVEGHTSTNDTVLLLANGAARPDNLSDTECDLFASRLEDVCTELARSIPSDGEGASHLITVIVRGCADEAEARQIAKVVADSPLVKTAITGADPNWGRIVSAAGYSGVPFEPDAIRLKLNGTPIFEHGTPLPIIETEVSESIRANFETVIELELARGNGAIRYWTCDLTAEYIRLNADYRT